MAAACDKLDKGSGACQTTGKDVEQGRRRWRDGKKNREREQKQAEGTASEESGAAAAGAGSGSWVLAEGEEEGGSGTRVHCGTRHLSAETEAAPKRAPDERHNANTINAS